jgi:hypothetical protein
LRLVLGTPAYQLALAYASVRAVCRLILGRRSWEKTAHFGLHMVNAAAEVGT